MSPSIDIYRSMKKHTHRYLLDIPFAASTTGAIGYNVSSKSNVKSPSCLTFLGLGLVFVVSFWVSECSRMDTTRDDTIRCGTKACAVNAKRQTCSSVAFIVVSFLLLYIWSGWGACLFVDDDDDDNKGRRDLFYLCCGV
jgi:hypothetical protein